MRRYTLVSGVFFSLLALVQLTRTVFAWPVQVAQISVPMWPSAVAFLITSSMAWWAFRTARGAA